MRSAFAATPDAIKIGESRFGWRSGIQSQAQIHIWIPGSRVKARDPE
jgi:hypothetical protein